MLTAKKLLLAPVVAAIAFVALQSFAPAQQQIECTGPNGECRITLSDGTVIQSTGQAKVTPVAPAPVQDANLTATEL